MPLHEVTLSISNSWCSKDALVQIITIAHEGLENIFKISHKAVVDGLTKIEELQQHNNNDIYEKSIKILETYFGVEDEEDMPSLAYNHGGRRNTDAQGQAQCDFS